MNNRAKKRINIYIYQDQDDDLKKLKVRDGIDPSESIRRAIDDWLVKKGVRPGQPPQTKGGRKNEE